jgi:excisionase family DNA binding protein
LAEGKMFNVKQVADMLGVHVETVRRWLREGKMHGVSLGHGRAGWRITEAEVTRVQREGL